MCAYNRETVSIAIPATIEMCWGSNRDSPTICRHRLRIQLEGLEMCRPNDGEVPLVERGKSPYAQPLPGSDNRSVDRAEWQVAVASDELGDPEPVGSLNRLGDEVTCGKVAQKTHLRLGS